MMRHLGLAGLLWWAVTAQASPTWNGLWRTPDQRAQQLLQQGKAAEASRLFQDPRRKAYAELQAGNFSQAAQDFHAFNDTDGQYNRGNALARAGHLQEAIQAYDAALAHDPDNADARHNRELVAKALQKQSPPPSQSASGKEQQGGKSPPGQSGQTQRGQNPSDSGKQNMHGGAQNGSAPKPSSGNAAQTGKPGQHPPGGASPKPGGADQPGQPPSGQQAVGQAGPSPGRHADASGSRQDQAANDAAQARHDAAAGLAKPQQAPQAAGRPPSERQLAEEQWLRRIPDDPGGLLRRKFMIEHLIRQQGAQP